MSAPAPVTNEEIQSLKPALQTLVLAVRDAAVCLESLIQETPDGLRLSITRNQKEDLVHACDRLIDAIEGIAPVEDTFTPREQEIFDYTLQTANEAVRSLLQSIVEIINPAAVNNATE